MPSPNQLFYGDNLDILRHHIAAESVDLIYLDPPFNSNRNYNVLFREKSGESSPAQIQAFTDTWEWDRAAEAAFDELVEAGPPNGVTVKSAMLAVVYRFQCGAENGIALYKLTALDADQSTFGPGPEQMGQSSKLKGTL